MWITASTNGARGASWEMGKLWRARSVWMPYSASAGTGSSPSGSRSIRVVRIAPSLEPGNAQDGGKVPDLLGRLPPPAVVEEIGRLRHFDHTRLLESSA